LNPDHGNLKTDHTGLFLDWLGLVVVFQELTTLVEMPRNFGVDDVNFFGRRFTETVNVNARF